MMTVCRRTRASRQIFSRPLHSLGVAAEVTEAPSGWQEEAVLFSVPPEGLSILESHRTSQHSASLSDRWSPKSPEKEVTQEKNADFFLLYSMHPLINSVKVVWFAGISDDHGLSYHGTLKPECSLLVTIHHWQLWDNGKYSYYHWQATQHETFKKMWRVKSWQDAGNSLLTGEAPYFFPANVTWNWQEESEWAVNNRWTAEPGSVFWLTELTKLTPNGTRRAKHSRFVFCSEKHEASHSELQFNVPTQQVYSQYIYFSWA